MANLNYDSPPKFLGQGLAFPIHISSQGSLQLNRALHNIDQSIAIILGTRLGERVYRPDFGSRLSELVFAPMNTQTLMLVRVYVQEALQRWEPRIILDRITTEPDPLRGMIAIAILYHAKATHTPHSLVYPFYLTPNYREGGSG